MSCPVPSLLPVLAGTCFRSPSEKHQVAPKTTDTSAQSCLSSAPFLPAPYLSHNISNRHRTLERLVGPGACGVLGLTSRRPGPLPPSPCLAGRGTPLQVLASMKANGSRRPRVLRLRELSHAGVRTPGSHGAFCPQTQRHREVETAALEVSRAQGQVSNPIISPGAASSTV